MSYRPKGETTHYILRVAPLLQPLLSLTHWIFRSLMLPYKSSSLVHPLLSLTHWIFRSLMLPYKSSSHSAKCVRCASLRSGGRRLAVRTAMEYPIGALPCTPFASSRHFPSRGNEGYEEKNSESYTSGTISAFSPFGGWRHHLSPASGGTIKLRYAVSCL